MGIGYDDILVNFFGKEAYVHNKNSDKWYVHDLNGDIISVMSNPYYLDMEKMSYFTVNDKGERVREEPFGW